MDQNKSVFDKDYFDCPHCGVKNVTFLTESDVEEDSTELPVAHHLIIRCTRRACRRLTYFQILKDLMGKGASTMEGDEDVILFQYPSGKSELPDYIPAKIRRFYKEAFDALNFGLLNSASIMCRKVIYELCDKNETGGRDYKEKIKNLGLDKRITDPLLNIKNIGDETVHTKGWDKETIEEAIDVLGIIIDMVYVQEERIKGFTKEYSAKVQTRKKSKE